MIKQSDLIAGIKQRKILPLYLLYGEEEFLIQESLDLLIAAIVDPAMRDFNFNLLYCRDTPAADVVSLSQTLPLMAERRLIIAKEIELWKSADIDILVSYLKDPSPSTCLALVSHQARYDKKSVLSAVETKGAVIRYYPLLERELTGWIGSRARDMGLSIQQEAVDYLKQSIGSDLKAISNELRKIALFMKDRKNVTLDDVKSVAGDFREYSSFDLASAIGRKNRGQALLVLSKLLREGEQPVQLLGAIAWNYRRLMQAKDMEAAGITQDDIMKKLRIIFHQTGLFREQMRNHSGDEVRVAFRIMLTTDRTLKSSRLSGGLILERMILRLCGA